MRKYRDASGQTRELNVTVRTIRRVLQDTGWNLANIATEMVNDVPLVAALRLNPDVLGKVLFAMLPSNERPDEDAFAECLDGNALKNAWTALYEELVDFFQSLGRPDMVAAMTAATPLVEAAMEEAVTKIRESLTSPLASGSVSTNSPVSAA